VVDESEAGMVAAAWAASAVTATQALHAVIDVRESAYTVMVARLGLADTDPTAALERLSLRWAAAAARSELVIDGGGTAARLAVGTSPGLLIPDRLAHAAVELLRTVDLSHIGVCPIDEGGCGWLFLDRSRNRSRRWCAMEDCGTHAKARRLTARRRAKRATSV
jgi:predicted RNA-binding Zn ribbon-like protein